MRNVKTGNEAIKAMNSFAQKGEIKAFFCGTAKILSERFKSELESAKSIPDKMKNITAKQAAGLQAMTALTCVVGGSVATALTGDTANLAVTLTGYAVALNVMVQAIIRDKPVLLKDIIDTVQNRKSFIKKAIEKGRA